MSDQDQSRRPADEDWIRALGEEARGLIRQLEGSSVQRISIQAGEYRIEIERGMAGAPIEATIMARPVAVEQEAGIQTAEVDSRIPVIAPLVGTFYRAPQPGARSFVEEGDVVDKDQTVAIVEAMKIMNQVQAGHSGRVAEIVVNDGEWVEYQQVLMYLEPEGL